MNARELMDKALASERGIAVECPSEGIARQTRQKCYTLRHATRIESPDSTSPWDGLEFFVEEKVLTISKVGHPKMKIKEL